MKNLAIPSFLIVLMIYLQACLAIDDNVVKQTVRIKFKNNTNKTINLWVDGESMDASNLTEPQGIREVLKVITFHVSNEEYANPVGFSVYAGYNGETLNTYYCTFNYDPIYNKIENIYPIQFNQDGSFSGF